MSAAKAQNAIWAVPRLMVLMRAEMKNTIASGAKMTTHLNGLLKMNVAEGRQAADRAIHAGHDRHGIKRRRPPRR